jgi:methionyl-tRNA formyltransferase
MRIIFCGTPDFAVPSLDALIKSGETILSVITQPDRAKGRGHKLSPPPVKEFAISKGIPVIQPSEIGSPSFMEELSKLKPELIVVVAYGKIIPLSILKIPPLGCINVHASLLPKYRGAAPIQWAIINGEIKTGITTIIMDKGLDTGDILLQEETAINDDNAFTLSLRLAETGASLLTESLNGLKDNSIHPIPQTGEPSFAPLLKKDDGQIRWSLPAKKINNLIRGTYPWPGAYCYLNEERINIIKAKVINTNDKGIPGKIEKVADLCIHVGTGDGILSVLEVKPEGKKTMSALAFIHGRHLKEGMHFNAT